MLGNPLRYSWPRWGISSALPVFGVAVTITSAAAIWMLGWLSLIPVAAAALVPLIVTWAAIRKPLRAHGALAAAQQSNLSEREELVGVIQRFARLGYWQYFERTGQVELSANLHDMLGDPGRTLRLTIPKLVAMTNPEDREQLQRALVRLVREGARDQFEFRITGLDGVERTFWSAGVRLEGLEDGSARGAFGAWQDITRQKALQAALLESEDHYRHAVELNPHIAWTEDPDGGGLDMDAGWLALTGMSLAEAQGGGWLKALHPDDVTRTEAAWAHCMQTGEPYDVEYRLRVADGNYRWFRARAAARCDTSGRIIRWYGTFEDIHDRRLADIALRESEAFARSILESSKNCVEVVGLDGRLEFMNGPGLELIEIDDISLQLGLEWVQIWPEESRDQVRAALKIARAGGTHTFTAFCPTTKGNPRWWEVCVTPIPGEDGKPVRVLSTSRDVTDAKRVQDQLDAARDRADATARRLEAVLESTSDSVITVGSDWTIGYVNPRAAAMIAKGRSLVGMTIWDALLGAAGSSFERNIRHAVENREAVNFEEFDTRLGIWLEIHAFPASDGLSIFFRDVTTRREAQARLEYLSTHDSLTGLANRSLLRDQLRLALKAAASESQTALLALDFDNFKSVNDTLGHPAGDALLVQAAERLRACVRDTDMVARLGGDEFAIVQTDIATPADAEALAQRIITVLGEPYVIEGKTVMIGVSVGIALVAHSGVTEEMILRDADAALYRAKGDGRGVFRMFEPGMERALTENRLLKADLHQALERDELFLVYQPVMDLGTRQVKGMEALVRWNHPQRGLLTPLDFIPLAEDCGMIFDIGSWVIRRACKDAAGWDAPASVAINLSPLQLQGQEIVRVVEESLQSSGLTADRLVLEITETALLHDGPGTAQAIDALRALGAEISIDDFGIGNSSITYLRRFPFDRLKIDQSFVAEMTQNRRTTEIVRAVITLAHGLGMKVTAEGIETEAQLALLRSLGCDEGQGFHLGHPVQLADVPRTLERMGRKALVTVS